MVKGVLEVLVWALFRKSVEHGESNIQCADALGVFSFQARINRGVVTAGVSLVDLPLWPLAPLPFILDTCTVIVEFVIAMCQVHMHGQRGFSIPLQTRGCKILAVGSHENRGPQARI